MKILFTIKNADKFPVCTLPALLKKRYNYSFPGQRAESTQRETINDVFSESLVRLQSAK